MSRQLLIDDNLIETRLALLEDGRLQHLVISPKGRMGIVGDIYLARVTTIDRDLNGAFVDLGGGQAAFLKAAHATKAAQMSNQKDRPGKSAAGKKPAIGNIISEGEKFPVQIMKQARPGKDAEVTTNIELAGSLSLIRPLARGITLSGRIKDPEIRRKITALAAQLLDANDMPALGGTFRTACETASLTEIEAELGAHLGRWRALTGRLLRMNDPAPAEPERDVIDKALAALPAVLGQDTEILVDGPLSQKAARLYFQRYRPALAGKVTIAPEAAALFAHYDVPAEIEVALQRIVSLPGGGSIVFDQTEAMMVIDVNSGAHKSGAGSDKFAFDVNAEAVIEIARQIRIRNIAGIIVIDCLQMNDKADAGRLLELFQSHIAQDPSHVHVAGMSPLGLLEISRRRRGPALIDLLLKPAAQDMSALRPPRAGTLAARIIRRARQEIRAGGKGPLLICTGAEVMEILAPISADLERDLGRGVTLKPLAESGGDGYSLSFVRSDR